MPPTFDRHQLTRLRKERGLTQTRLADLSGVSQQVVSGWERGRVRPEINTLPKLAEVLGCKIDDFYGCTLTA